MEDLQEFLTEINIFRKVAKSYVKIISRNFYWLKIISKIVTFTKSPISHYLGIFIHVISLHILSTVGLPLSQQYLYKYHPHINNLR